jgi:V8-like Glu-specific endopeptidase
LKYFKKTIEVIFFFILSTKGNSQNIPEVYRKTVVFLSNTNEVGERHNLGTGFFIAIPDSNLLYGYLVTAKHVLLNPGSILPFEFIQVAYNKKNGSRDSVLVSVKATGLNKNIYYHQDLSVDLAVIPLAIEIDSSDVRYSVEKELFRSKIDFDTSYVKPGTNLFYTGMFSPYLGYNKNYPITRFGKVALITEEKIKFEKSEMKASLFLAETTTFGGNSGSPVFAFGSDYKINSHDPSDPINTKEQNNVPIYLIGIMKGYFQENAPIEFMNTSTMTPTYSSNIGIAAIIPSYLLYEILEDLPLKTMRKNLKTSQK